MKRLLALLALSVSVSLSLALSHTSVARAQAGGPTAEPTLAPGERAGVVTGQLVNGTAGGVVPGNLAMMLHAWDDTGETVMLDGTVDDQGAFRFEDVPMKDGWTFAAMVGYNDVSFFSDFVPLEPGLTELSLPLTVYEKTTETAAVRVAQLHTLLEFVAGEMSVTEVYVLSNLGDRAVSGGVTLPDGSSASLQFALPAGANEVSFKGNDSNARFVMMPDGFADTAPLVPGQSTSQVLVSYSLPYQTGMTVAHALQYPVEGLNVLHRADAGVTVSGQGLDAPTQRDMGEGQTFTLYAGESLAAGSNLTLTVSGQPNFLPAAETSAATDAVSPAPSDAERLAERYALPAGGTVLGLALIGAGVWWLRRNGRSELDDEAEAEGEREGEAAPDDWESLLRRIAELDDAHARGEVPEGVYAEQRGALKAQARAILKAEPAQPAPTAPPT